MREIAVTNEHEFAGRPLGFSREVADGVFAVNAAFWGFPNVVYFLRSGRTWALVDSGVAETPARAIAPFLEQHGGFGSLELVMGTHGHVDHIGGNAWLKQHAPQARFALGALDTDWAEDPHRHYETLYVHGAPGGWRPDSETEQVVREAIGGPVAIDHPLVGGEVLTFGLGREIETVHLGAHSPGQTLYIDRMTGCAFSGDAVQGAGIMNTSTGLRDFPMYRTLSDYRASLEAIRSLRPALLCTAHAGIHERGDVDGFIDRALAWGVRFTETILDIATEHGSFSMEELVEHLGERMPEYALILQVRVTAGEHLNALVARGDLVPTMEGGAKRWTRRQAPAPASSSTVPSQTDR
ncbi:hypothetical protein C5B96_16075 [Subtercola sp. Z020]|nr:hypothetical protein C5B96_16075 [Subtercola sp. Z020]